MSLLLENQTLPSAHYLSQPPEQRLIQVEKKLNSPEPATMQLSPDALIVHKASFMGRSNPLKRCVGSVPKVIAEKPVQGTTEPNLEQPPYYGKQKRNSGCGNPTSRERERHVFPRMFFFFGIWGAVKVLSASSMSRIGFLQGVRSVI